MRLCLFATGTGTSVGAYDEQGVVDLTGLALLAGEAPPREPLDLLGPGLLLVGLLEYRKARKNETLRPEKARSKGVSFRHLRNLGRKR